MRGGGLFLLLGPTWKRMRMMRVLPIMVVVGGVVIVITLTFVGKKKMRMTIDPYEAIIPYEAQVVTSNKRMVVPILNHVIICIMIQRMKKNIQLLLMTHDNLNRCQV
jgi:uncharacterized membrane protein (UPF0182 family)